MHGISIFTNSPGKDQVLRPYLQLMASADNICLAAPYFSRWEEIVEAAGRGASISLLVGLNAATNPGALAKVRELPNCSVRYFTDGFHAKIFLFDGVAMLGSANLTNGGMSANREAVILLDQPGDADRVQNIEQFFAEVWGSAAALTDDVFRKFRDAWEKSSGLGNRDAPFQIALADVEPPTILAGSGHKSDQQLYLGALQKMIYEEYRPAYEEVTAVLAESGLLRPEFADLDPGTETNRFLNWVRLEHAGGDASWQDAPLRSPNDRRILIQEFGREWVATPKTDIPGNYFELLQGLHSTLGTPESILASSRDQIAEALLCVHAFHNQLRFTRGGADRLPAKFWEGNQDDLERVQKTLVYLVHGNEDFAVRICNVLYSDRYKLFSLGKFSALELVGTLKPNQCPAINGRMAKALRFLGFKVKPQ